MAGKPLRMTFYTEGLPFDGETIEKQSLGGSETAMYYITKELAALGNHVTLFCNTSRDAYTWDGVEYRKVEGFQKFCEESNSVESPGTDVLVLSRHIQHAAQEWAKARCLVLWPHDCFLPEVLAFWKSVLWKTDLLAFNSEFHRKQFDDGVKGLPTEVYFPTRNGVDLAMIRDAIEGVERVENRLIYTSRPDRGLDVLLAMWPDLKRERPELELRVMWYDFPEADKTHLAPMLAVMDAQIEQLDGVTRLPAMPKRELMREVAAAKMLVYPSIFPEISCISAIEAMACGTPVVASSYCALKETVPHGETALLVGGAPRVRNEGGWIYGAPATKYTEHFIEAVGSLLDSESDWQRLSDGGRARAERYDYKVIAREWDARLREEVKLSDHKQTVSACMIVKDGEDTLHRCLKSIRNQVDEIIVFVDDRTKDSSGEIARKYTDKVFPYTWEDSFAAARNLSIERATCDWILWIDADEWFVGNLRPYLRTNAFNSYPMRQTHIGPGHVEHSDWPARLFRNHLGARFFGRVHEQPDLRLNEGVPKQLGLANVRIVHDGYADGLGAEEKWERNHALVSRDMEELPERDITFFSYCRDLVAYVRRRLGQTNNVLTPDLREMLVQVAVIYKERFSSPHHLWHKHVLPLYQDALRFLGKPEMFIVLAGTTTPVENMPDFQPTRRFFIDADEFREHLVYLSEELIERLRRQQDPNPYPFDEE